MSEPTESARLTAELAAMTKDRDYHRAACIDQSVYWRGVYEDRIATLEADLTDARYIAREQEDHHVAAKMRLAALEAEVREWRLLVLQEAGRP